MSKTSMSDEECEEEKNRFQSKMATEEGGRGGGGKGKMGEREWEIQASSYRMNESWG